MIRLLLLPVLFVFALLGASTAVNLTGAWTGTIDVKDTDSGSVISTPVRLTIDQNNDIISGKIGRDGESDVTPIQHARLEGNKLSFEAVNADVNGPVKFVLILQDDHLEGEMKASVDTGEITGRVKIAKEKK